MISLNYVQRYKRVLRKKKITMQDVNEFNDAVKAYVNLYPDWKAKTNIIKKERNLAS